MPLAFTKPHHGLFVTGTDTGVGKTYVAALIARSLRSMGRRVGVYKPVASGCRRRAGKLIADDAVALRQAAGRPGSLEEVCPQRFEAPLAPHLAAQAEHRQLDSTRLRTGLQAWTDRCDVVIVEGAGGLLSPIGDQEYVADLAREFGYPLVVVAPNTLGTINQTLQTLVSAATFRGGLKVAGIVLNDAMPGDNDPSRQSNFDQLACRCRGAVLTHVAWRAETADPDVDWRQLATEPPTRCAVRFALGHD